LWPAEEGERERERVKWVCLKGEGWREKVLGVKQSQRLLLDSWGLHCLLCHSHPSTHVVTAAPLRLPAHWPLERETERETEREREREREGRQ